MSGSKKKEPVRRHEAGDNLEHRINLRLTEENYQAMVELGVIRDKRFAALVNDLLKGYVEAGGVSSAAVNSFAARVDQIVDARMKEQQGEMLYWLKQIYKSARFAALLEAKNTTEQGKIRYAQKRTWQDYIDAAAKTGKRDQLVMGDEEQPDVKEHVDPGQESEQIESDSESLADEVSLTAKKDPERIPDGAVCPQTGMVVNRHAYDTGLPDSKYHASREDLQTAHYYRDSADALKKVYAGKSRAYVSGLTDLAAVIARVYGDQFEDPDLEKAED